MTTIDMSDGRPKEPRRLRELAAWYRVFAEEAGNPVIWEARLRTAADLEKEANRLEGGRSLDNKTPRIFGDKQGKFSGMQPKSPDPG